MYKLLFSTLKYIFVLSLILFIYKIMQYKMAQLFSRYSYSQLLRKQTNHQSSHSIDLTAFPVLGDMYLLQKIMELQNLKRYDEAQADLNQAIYSIFHPDSFILWYLKAYNEIALKLFDEAQQSLVRASFLAKKNNQDLALGKLYDRLNRIKIVQNRVNGESSTGNSNWADNQSILRDIVSVSQQQNQHL